jgi:hypothetical protein
MAISAKVICVSVLPALLVCCCCCGGALGSDFRGGNFVPRRRTHHRFSSRRRGRRSSSSATRARQRLAFIAGAAASPAVARQEETLWAIRIASAIASYVGFVACLDRPRGELLLEEDSQIEIRPSTVEGAGLGLFARTFLPRGTVMGTYPGVVIPLRQNLDKLRRYPACEGYIWRFSDNKFVIDPTGPTGVLDPVCRGGNPSLPLSILIHRTLLSPFLSANTALCRINEPPRGMGMDVRNVITNEDLLQRSVTFELERDVFAGEEFFIDYGLSYDRSMYRKADRNEA